MKPVVLRLQAFNAYANEQVVDFRMLAGHTLMMISGETGAGKTALLDAMCYALFGQSTGELRAERTIRSDHATLDTPTYVDLQFELNSKIYRAHRMPPQVGKSTGLVEFFELSDIDDVNAKPLATGKTNVEKAVRTLLGYNVNQFRSIVMLPQGQFRDFLSADTKKKAELLSALFQTERYALLQKSLKDRADELGKAQAENLKRIDQSLRVAGVETEAELHTLLTESNELIKTYQTQQTLISTACKTAEGNLIKATALAGNFQRREDALAKCRVLEALAPTRKAERMKLAAANIAQSLNDVDGHRTFRMQEAVEALREMEQAQTCLNRDQGQLKDANEAAETSRKSQPERDAARRRLDTLRALIDPIKELVEALENQRQGQVKLVAEKQELDESKVKQVAFQSEHMSVQAREKRLIPIAADKTAAHLRLAEAMKEAHRADKLRLLTREASTATRNLQQEHEHNLSLKDAVLDAQREHRTLYGQHLHAYAARLAGELISDEPCRVCGSTTHPNPALEAEEDPGESKVQAALKTFRDHEDQVRQHQLKIVKLQTRMSDYEAQIEVLTAAMNDSVDLDPTRFENQVRVAEASLAAATTAESEIAVASSRLDVLNALLTEQTANQKRLEYALKETEKSQAVIGARVADRRAQIPDDHGSLAELNTLIAAEHIAHDKALSLADKVESTAAALALACAASASLAENTRKSVAHANQVSREAQLNFEARVAEAGFGDLDAYRAARLESDEIVSLEETLRQYDHDSTSAKGILDHLNEQLTGIEHPELDALRAMVIEARAKLEAVEADLLRMREAVSPMVRARQEIDELKKASAIREAEYGIMATLRDVAQGKGPNQSGIQFERYILAGLLDEVLVHATTRLRIMSDGRYTIQRKDPNRARTTIFVHDKRRETGLELEVVDTFTGKERDAGTLSGGEGFQASLSLALGLADVVQAQSGGIQLSAMFIDEGFGTQSEEALDAVLDTLTGLQASGRLVGFISHVKELKTRIPAQLHVHKTTTGSHVQWVIR